MTQRPTFSPTYPLPLAAIDPATVEPTADALLERARAAVEEIAGTGAPPTYENTMLALEAATAPVETFATLVSHLEAVATTPTLRAAHEAIQPKIAAFYAALPLHEGLFRRIEALAATDLGGTFPFARRHVTRTRDAFVRHGARLDAAGKAEIERLDVELARRTTTFAQRVLDANAAYAFHTEDEGRLAGLPPMHVEAAAAAARARGRTGYVLTLDAPSYVPAMTYLEDRSLRRELWWAYHRRAADEPYDNRPLVREILALRRRKARTLGFPTFAHLVLADRMLSTPEKASGFVDDLARRTRPAFERERAELESFAGTSLEPWDLAFHAERLRRARYDFDAEALRPYFPLGSVRRGMFEIATRLFGLAFERRPDADTWHPDVEVFGVRDERGEFLGDLHVDLFPRSTKRSGAWMNGLLVGHPPDDPHVVVLCANLTPPLEGKEALLSHEDVMTLFHEFGHGLHHLASRVPVRSLACTNVAWDFVELPSQIMENWCWERRALDLFARHHETGEPMPDDLFARMTAARTFRAATAMMRQLGFARVDLVLHVDFDPEGDEDPFAAAHRVLSEYSPVPLPEGDAMLASFQHLFADPVGYAAGYYSYKWAEVLEADCFSRFAGDHVLDPDVGRAFRDTILAKGDTEDPWDLVRAFLGRDPSPEALLRRDGLLPPNPSRGPS
ncbi:MAG: M3 family peptidase [Deltaproteobacteria bacterium]|nr:MAG: M3 family peptidase [Deltaproteobacteria bacterium]